MLDCWDDAFGAEPEAFGDEDELVVEVRVYPHALNEAERLEAVQEYLSHVGEVLEFVVR